MISQDAVIDKNLIALIAKEKRLVFDIVNPRSRSHRLASANLSARPDPHPISDGAPLPNNH